MKILRTVKELKSFRNKQTCELGFVPTMGALHQGHISLIKQSVEENPCTLVSIFVNPAQFSENEDFSTYPRKIEADLKICELANVDAVFLPKIEEIYSKAEPSLLAPSIKGYILEGYNRPGHFDGVLQVVLKLFNLVKPKYAYFGKKDAQQLFLIQNMVETFFLDIKIVPCEIIRDERGLALSSRNIYLSEVEKEKALSISKSLKIASREVMQGNLNADAIKEKMQAIMSEIQVEYIAITDRDFEKTEKIVIKNTIILVAAKVGQTRLIDNIWI